MQKKNITSKQRTRRAISPIVIIIIIFQCSFKKIQIYVTARFPMLQFTVFWWAINQYEQVARTAPQKNKEIKIQKNSPKHIYHKFLFTTLCTLLTSNMKNLKNQLEINQISLVIKMFIESCCRQSFFFLHKQHVAYCILYGLKSNGQ